MREMFEGFTGEEEVGEEGGVQGEDGGGGE